jgi:H+/Cl- antiporter ClcA
MNVETIKFKHLRTIAKIKNHFLSQMIMEYFKELYIAAKEANSQFKLQFFQFLPFLLSSLITGAVAFGYYKAFRYAEELSFSIYEQNRLYIFLITPISFLLSWWLVKRYAPYSRGSGIPQVMGAIEVSGRKKNYIIKNFVSLRIIIVKILSSIIKVFGGGVLGREGPTIQISSSIFVVIHKMLPSWWPHVSQKNILIAGAASGLAAAFNTPLGGIIFAIEELSKFHVKHYQFSLFIGVIIAGLTAQGLGGSYLYLGYPKLTSEGWSVLYAILITALLSGYLGSKTGVIMLKIMDLFSLAKSNTAQIGVVLLSAFLVAIPIYYFGTNVMGSGKELMESLLFNDNKQLEWYIPFVRISNLITSFSFGGSGGVFAPSLSSGAAIGAIVSQYFDIVGTKANLIILVGMTSFLTGMTRAPFTSAIIVFEMTDRHSVIFFLLFAAIIANMIATFVDKQSFYDRLKAKYIKDATSSKEQKVEPKVVPIESSQ